ncbi:LysM peptidoglycan-binding domain-containing protein [Chitinibacter bivalviorum]|uniref:LysM peptidoglycan-binding domain-containing protein n=1 Tax=Chitinibacter bivalviorum TaxID=2739434 RepID=A0A7H9BJ12_9NEIS|nr:LysM peptidoglycan-binding domain-containing protein [Chitinibacter bivalviorum]QLG88633.1 LysM peptidoglycan-binding domain-containing protein [Chitinibacter bivalviorum]
MKLRLCATLFTAFLSLPALAIESGKLDYELHSITPPLSANTQAVIDQLFSEANPLIERDLWVRVRNGFAIPDIDSPLVTKWENYYSSRPDYLNRIIERSNRYLYYVVGEVERRNMPMEFALLPMIESAYNPRAESPAKAAGMWQFIPDTGKRYGLERTMWYDGRRDVVAATDAALSYLQDIHGMFDDWQLALASYNWGENAVKRAIDKNIAAGLPTAFVDLKMPDETRNYVPKLLAIRNIIADPAAYGVKLSAIPNQPYFATLQPGKHMDVSVAAKLAGISVDELLKLNPGFIRPVIAHKDERKLVLPVAQVPVFERNLAAYDQPLLNWQPYVTKHGDRVEDLASTFGISEDQLRDINDIGSKERVAAGKMILVPKVAGIDISERQTLAALHENRNGEAIDTGEKDTPKPVIKVARDGSHGREHKVAKGDTLFNIAKRYDLSVAELKAMNNLKGNQVALGESLTVGNASNAPKSYVVKRGDTLASIAKKLNIDLYELKKSNRKPISPGMILVMN